MVDEIGGKKNPDIVNSFGNNDASLTKAAKNQQLGKDEFLKLLVTQLKHQDPLEPMKNEQFAVNLAQFSQLERLISIDDKIGGEEGAGGISSLASYLGHEVVLDTNVVHVEGGKGESLKFKLSQDARDVAVDLKDGNGKVVETIQVGSLVAGEHRVELDDVRSPKGDYSFEIRGASVTGGQFNPQASVVGIVTGYAPGPDPQLIVNGREVSPSKVKQVHVASTAL